ncbi:multidrug efflux SMR transporter [bacterium LRH843]|nr:multidrug efflux SMR transporter [bacterium LRH843]
MEWIYITVAGLFEMLGVTLMNQFSKSKTKTNLVLLIAAFALSFFFLSLAMERLPMGTAYALWTGIGAAGGVIVGMVLYGESRSWKRIFFLGLLLSATIGLKLVG